ncbi:hypothetical protein Bbelb_388340 [Branchiostoma belcheri]|nr:hypothetical protein Bbelb_388340 [Branchiostoma belcheri]
MWHEARRQEKKLRGMMVDYRKRAERRREYYEKIKMDPTQFLRVYGQHHKINLDPAVSFAAEGPGTMMPWQGDTENMVDRFDVRAHLDFIPEYKGEDSDWKTSEAYKEEQKANYERYRTMVLKEVQGFTEEQVLQQIYIEETYGEIPKFGTTEEEKNKHEAETFPFHLGLSSATFFTDHHNSPIDARSSDILLQVVLGLPL